MSGGTVALVFVTLASLPAAGTPPAYNRHVIPAGATTEPIPERNVVNADVFWAFQKVVRSRNVSGYLNENALAAAPMKNTLTACRAYAREKIPLFEEAEEQQEGTTISDYQCVYVPDGYKLINYMDRYDRSNPRHIVPTNPYRIEKAPKPSIEPALTGPECLYVHPYYPPEVEEDGDNLEGKVVAYCDKEKGGDGYYRPVNCQIVKKEGSKEFINNKKFDESALDSLRDGFGCSKEAGPKDPDNGRYTYNISYGVVGNDN